MIAAPAALLPKGTNYHLVEALRRLVNVVRPGTVAEVDLETARVRVRYAGAGDDSVLTGWLPWVVARAGADAEWWPPSVGEQVVLLAPNGELAQAFALPAAYSNAHPAPSAERGRRVTRYADGAEIVYDAVAHRLSATLPAGAAAVLEADGGIALNGDVTVTGTLRVSADIEADGNVQDSDGTMTEMRTTYNGHNHPTSQGPTGAPTQKMN